VRRQALLGTHIGDDAARSVRHDDPPHLRRGFLQAFVARGRDLVKGLRPDLECPTLLLVVPITVLNCCDGA
jgi:hypothetical protein